MDPVPFPQSEVFLAIAMGYKHKDCIAERVLPIVRVSEEKFTYHEINIKDQLQMPDTKVGRKSRPNEVEYSSTERSLRTDDHALDDFVPNSDLDKARPGFNPRTQAANSTMKTIKLTQEKRVADTVFSDDAYESNQIEDLTATPFGTTSTKVVDIIGDAIDSAIITPNQATMGFDVFSKMRRNPQVLKAVHGNLGDAGIASLEQLEQLFGLTLIVGNADYDMAKEGQPMQWGKIWKNHLALQHIDESASANDPSLTHGFLAHYDDVGGELPDPHRGIKGGVSIRVGHQRTEVIAAKIAGRFLKNCA